MSHSKGSILTCTRCSITGPKPREGPRAETDMSVVVLCLFTSADLVRGFKDTFCFSSENEFSNFPKTIIPILQMFLHFSVTADASV